MDIIIGTKKGMTQIFNEEGNVVPCTILDVSEVKVVGKRTKEKDGYEAIILGMGKRKKANKAQEGKFKELEYVPQFVSEFRVDEEEDIANINIGDEVSVKNFKVGDKVNVTGTTKGKGFQGVVKRWGFHGGSRTHGQSDRERAPGSIGAGTDPGRVFKGKKMPGHMGAKTKTVLNLPVVKLDEKNSLICVMGAVPGAYNSIVKVRKS
jgi:large subunit ribosomal protein L3